MGNLIGRLKKLGVRSSTDVALLFATGAISREDWDIFSKNQREILANC